MVYIAFFNSMLVISRWPVHLSMLSLSFLKPVHGTILFLSHWLLSHITIVETMDSSERKFESCRNDYHQSLERILGKPGIEPATSCSPVLQSEQRGSAWQMVVNILWNFRPLVFFAARPSYISRACWCLLETMYETDILLLKEET